MQMHLMYNSKEAAIRWAADNLPSYAVLPANNGATTRYYVVDGNGATYGRNGTKIERTR